MDNSRLVCTTFASFVRATEMLFLPGGEEVKEIIIAKPHQTDQAPWMWWDRLRNLDRSANPLTISAAVDPWERIGANFPFIRDSGIRGVRFVGINADEWSLNDCEIEFVDSNYPG